MISKVRHMLQSLRKSRNLWKGILPVKSTPRKLSPFFALLLVIVHIDAIAEVTIIDQDLVYAVSYGKTNVGNLEISLRNENGDYLLTSITKPSTLASLVLKEHTSETKFILRNGELALHSAVEKLKGKESYDRGFTFDYENHTIELAEEKSSTFQSGDQFESVTFPLLLMYRDVNSIAGMEVSEVSPKRLRSYTYAEPEQETVKVPAGEFESWKIPRFRTDRPEDTVTVWLDQSDNPIPVKIEINKGGKVSTLVLSKN